MVHRAVDNVLDGLANGATGAVSSLAGAVKGIGKSVINGLEKPFRDITGREGPLRAVDTAADGVVNAGVNAVNQGLVGSVKIAGKGVMTALDHPLRQIGLNSGKAGGMKLPWQK